MRGRLGIQRARTGELQRTPPRDPDAFDLLMEHHQRWENCLQVAANDLAQRTSPADMHSEDGIVSITSMEEDDDEFTITHGRWKYFKPPLEEEQPDSRTLGWRYVANGTCPATSYSELARCPRNRGDKRLIRELSLPFTSTDQQLRDFTHMAMPWVLTSDRAHREWACGATSPPRWCSGQAGDQGSYSLDLDQSELAWRRAEQAMQHSKMDVLDIQIKHAEVTREMDQAMLTVNENLERILKQSRLLAAEEAKIEAKLLQVEKQFLMQEAEQADEDLSEAELQEFEAWIAYDRHKSKVNATRSRAKVMGEMEKQAVEQLLQEEAEEGARSRAMELKRANDRQETWARQRARDRKELEKKHHLHEAQMHQMLADIQQQRDLEGQRLSQKEQELADRNTEINRLKEEMEEGRRIQLAEELRFKDELDRKQEMAQNSASVDLDSSLAEHQKRADGLIRLTTRRTENRRKSSSRRFGFGN